MGEEEEVESLKQEIEELKKSIKELFEATKKLQQSERTNAGLLDALLKRDHGEELKKENAESAVDDDLLPVTFKRRRCYYTMEPSDKKRANESPSETPLSAKKPKPTHTPQRTGKNVLVHCSQSEVNLKKQEIEEMKKSIKELSEAMKKLQQSERKKAGLLDVLLKRYHEDMKGSGVDDDVAPVVEAKENEFTCCFKCEDAKGNNDQTIFVKGFERVRPKDEIKNELSNIFSSCGEMTRVFVPMECEIGVPLGFAFINFTHPKGKEKALKLNGSYIGGREIEVTMAKERDEYHGYNDFNGCDRCLMPMASRRTLIFNEKIKRREKKVF